MPVWEPGTDVHKLVVHSMRKDHQLKPNVRFKRGWVHEVGIHSSQQDVHVP